MARGRSPGPNPNQSEQGRVARKRKGLPVEPPASKNEREKLAERLDEAEVDGEKFKDQMAPLFCLGERCGIYL